MFTKAARREDPKPRELYVTAKLNAPRLTPSMTPVKGTKNIRDCKYFSPPPLIFGRVAGVTKQVHPEL